jgi:predicted ATPase/tetratricopeptide (TPR) repeat protein
LFHQVVVMNRKTPRTNLPIERGAFVGRGKQLDDLSAAMAKHNIVVLHGPAGVGKTRLALRHAGRELAHFGAAGGVWLVEMLDAQSAADAVRLLGLSLGIMPDGSSTPLQEEERVARLLVERGRTLFVLDGAGVAVAAALPLLQRLATLAQATFLLTSRESWLGLPATAHVLLSTLRTPKDGAEPRSLPSTEAVELFLERMAEVRRSHRSMTMATEELIAVGRIVRQLEGSPLAIELAAARCRVLTPGELLERLPRRVDLLGGRDPRATLAGAVAWSVELLSGAEKAILAQAAIFHGGFTREAARQVFLLSGERSIDEVVDALIDKALFVQIASADDDDPRYSLPQAVREVVVSFRPTPSASKRPGTLEMPGEHQDNDPVDARISLGTTRGMLIDRHAQYTLLRAGKLAENADGHGGLAARRQLDAEVDNLLAVVRRNLADEQPQTGMVAQALVGLLALEPILTTRGPHELFVRLLDRALPLADTMQVAMPSQLRCLEARARALRGQGMLQRSLADLELLVERAQVQRDPLLLGRAWANLGTHHLLAGQLDDAQRCYETAMPILDGLRDKRLAARARGFTALLCEERGQLAEACTLYEATLEQHQALGDRRFEAIHRGQLGRAQAERGDLDHGEDNVRRALALHRELGGRRNEGLSLLMLGDIALAQENSNHAEQHWQKSLTAVQAMGDATTEAVVAARLALLLRAPRNTEAADFALQRSDDRQAHTAVAILRGQLTQERGGIQVRAASRVFASLSPPPSAS